MTFRREDTDRLFATDEWAMTLPQPFRACIAQSAQGVSLRAGEALFRRGNPPSGLYAVMDGGIAIETSGEDGRTMVLTILEATSWFGEIAVVDRLPRTHDARAVRTTKLLHLSQAVLLEFLDGHPQCWHDIARLITQKLRLSFLSVELLAMLPARQRLATRLLMIAGGYNGAGPAQNEIQLSQEMLADMVAASRQTVNQVLKQLEANGALSIKQGRLVIRDLALLRKASHL